jgi:hypothetical protein
VLRCIPPAFPAPALLRATFYEFKRTPVTMINTMTPVRWRCPSCIYTGYLRCADERKVAAALSVFDELVTT